MSQVSVAEVENDGQKSKAEIGPERGDVNRLDASPTKPDPYDPASYRQCQNYGEGLGVKTKIQSVSHRPMPAKEWWVRAHPEYEVQMPFLDLKEDRELYLIAPDPALVSLLEPDPNFKMKLVVLAVTRDNTPFLWHLRVPGIDGRTDDWMNTALEAVREARERWVRVFARKTHYDLAFTEADWPDPHWPEEPFRDLLELGFKSHTIDSAEHPKVQRLLGKK
jgi:hypothetical protein